MTQYFVEIAEGFRAPITQEMYNSAWLSGQYMQRMATEMAVVIRRKGLKPVKQQAYKYGGRGRGTVGHGDWRGA